MDSPQSLLSSASSGDLMSEEDGLPPSSQSDDLMEDITSDSGFELASGFDPASGCDFGSSCGPASGFDPVSGFDPDQDGDLMGASSPSDSESEDASLVGAPVSTHHRSLIDVFRWATYLVAFLHDILSAPLLHSSLLGNRLSVSSFFSGVATAELALQSLYSACLCADFGGGFDLVSVCDSGRKNLSILKQLVPSNCCILNNILNLSPVARVVFKEASAVGELDFWQTWEKIRRGGLFDNVSGCVQHPTQGSCACPATMLDISGSPCNQWSSAGKGLGERSPLTVLLMVWCLWVLIRKPLILIHENVVGFDVAILTQLLGGFYDHVILKVSPAHAGFPFVVRKRLYMVFFLRGKVTAVANIPKVYEEVSQRFQSLQPPRLEDCFVASDEELIEEVKKVQKLREQDGIFVQEAQLHSSGWSELLTPKQRQRLQELSGMWQRRHGVLPHLCQHCLLNLGHNPVRRQMTGRDGGMPTITTNCRLWWAPYLRRWLLPCELAVMMGFPTSRYLAEAAGLQSHSTPFESSQVGKAMHLANVGCVMGVSLACLSVLP